MIASFHSRTSGGSFLIDAMPGSCSAPPASVGIGTFVGTVGTGGRCVDAAPIDLDVAPPIDLIALCTGDSDSGVIVPLGRAGATFEPTGDTTDPLDGRAKLVAVGDFTGDGVDDVAVLTEIASVPTIHLLAQCATTTIHDACVHEERR
jgi:hypothetical protein